MDWSKIKTVLIWAFLITNLLLGYTLYRDMVMDPSREFFSDEYIENLDKLLEKKSIKLDTELMRNGEVMGPISVAYEFYREEQLDKVFSEGDGEYTTVDNKEIRYKGKMMFNDFNEKEAKINTEIFLEKYGFTKDRYLKSIEKDTDYIRIIYSAKRNEYFLDGCYMEFFITTDGNFTFKSLWFKPIDESFQKERIITSVEALIKAYNKIPSGSRIVEVIPGYYLDTNLNNKNTTMAKAFPVWRIKLEGDKFIYIQALEF